MCKKTVVHSSTGVVQKAVPIVTHERINRTIRVNMKYESFLFRASVDSSYKGNLSFLSYIKFAIVNVYTPVLIKNSPAKR